jgi:hypothetical protein
MGVGGFTVWKVRKSASRGLGGRSSDEKREREDHFGKRELPYGTQVMVLESAQWGEVRCSASAFGCGSG